MSIYASVRVYDLNDYTRSSEFIIYSKSFSPMIFLFKLICGLFKLGRTIRYPDPLVKCHDSIRLDINTGKIMDFIKFEAGNLCMITGGRNTGRVGTIMHRERHPGSFDIIHVKDSVGHTFATRMNYVFTIGKGSKAYISLPKGAGIKLSIAEERDKRLGTTK